MQGMAPGKVLGNKECSRHLDTVCGWVCRTAMEECEMKLLESTIQGFVDLVEAFGFYPKSNRDGAGVGEGGVLMIFILKSPLWLLLEDGREGECGQLGVIAMLMWRWREVDDLGRCFGGRAWLWHLCGAFSVGRNPGEGRI